MRTALSAALLVTAVLGASCGTSRTTEVSSGPPPVLSGAELRGPLPGEEVTGNFRDEKGGAVSDVHILLRTGTGPRRAVLLLGRRNRRPCVGASTEATVRNARLDCFESFEDPPLVAKVVVGGGTGRHTDWLAVLGLARSPTDRVSVDTQDGLKKAQLDIRTWPGFPWQAFATSTTHGALANELKATDENGKAVELVDLGFSYNSPCEQDNRDVCGSNPGGPWAESRDPVRDQSSQTERAVKLAFAHPAIRRLVAGHRYFIEGSAEWDSCGGSRLGSVVTFRIWPRVSFRGEIPLHDYAKDGEDVAYREGRASVEAEGVAAVDVWVDENRERVVGIEVDAFDETDDLTEQSPARITKLEMTDDFHPAGGPDDASQCPKVEPGE